MSLLGKKFQFVGGDLCLDFCNTVGGKRGVIARENLHGYADLLSWTEQAGLIGKNEAATLAAASARNPDAAASVLNRAVSLREAIYRIFAAIGEEKAPPSADLARLNSELAATLGRLRMARHKHGFGWEWADPEQHLDHPLGPVARSAAELLTTMGALPKIRRCEGHNCGWLFLDASKNHSRRWCDMRDCGNRAKVRRHRLKQRSDA